jgi:hypothetical protein
MNDIFHPPPLRRVFVRVPKWFFPARTAGFLAAAVLALFAAGCADQDGLQARSLPEEPASVIAVEAQVAGPMTGLTYKWFAVSGECLPQESGEPKTMFRFSEGARLDQVTVEVWRKQKRIARDELKVRYGENQGRREQRRSPEAQIEITTIPPAEPGGPASGATIVGRVSGKITAEHMVAIYARAYGAWYIQPEARALHSINADHTWKSWIHTGGRYAALLVRRDFEPLNKLDMLPETNSYVLAIDVVDGAFKAETNAAPAAAPAAW